jgi:hypothetical protein
VRKVLIALVAWMLAVPAGTFALVAPVSADDGAETRQGSVVKSVSPLRDGIRVEAARLANARVPDSASAAQVTERERSWPGQHPVFLGTVIGLGAGLAITARSECHKSSDYTCGQIATVLGGIGAGIGAGVGGIVALFLR